MNISVTQTKSVKLSPGEFALFESIIEHVYPDPKEGSTLPLDEGDSRAAKGLARKGLVMIAEDCGRPAMTFTALGAAIYQEQLAVRAA
ncbi:hypothetical protein [Pandoraea sp. ISTKB]|uniref:hypothetical protein n=1 Tax=Pandoraea sp. ISTKB TaxID=1586708 RepID=UPI000847853C|nr:hypothetical protein [Pandoraea sp. ISTKB]ODP35136.1 hypothetical protein A9762_12330 [Pandoraea sp. ISTKB]